jgi:hypothetical protein
MTVGNISFNSTRIPFSKSLRRCAGNFHLKVYGCLFFFFLQEMFNLYESLPIRKLYFLVVMHRD